MAYLLKLVTKTVYPDSRKDKIHENGMLVKRRVVTDKELNLWFRWLNMLAYKNHWRNSND